MTGSDWILENNTGDGLFIDSSTIYTVALILHTTGNLVSMFMIHAMLCLEMFILVLMGNWD